MKRIFLFIIILVIIGVSGVLIYQNLFKEREGISPKEISMPEKSLENKKIVMIVAFRDFRDEEYFVPSQILREAGAEIVTASTEKGTALGSQGGEAEVNSLISDVNVSDFDALVFVGGSGSLPHLDNEASYKIALDAVSENKVLAAICIAPTILAKAGVLEGKKATVWSSPLDRSAVKVLEENGAEYVANAVVVDENIVTATGPSAATQFGEKIIEVLTKE